MSTEQTSKNIFTYLNGLNWSKVKANLDEIFDFFSKVSVITWQSGTIIYTPWIFIRKVRLFWSEGLIFDFFIRGCKLDFEPMFARGIHKAWY